MTDAILHDSLPNAPWLDPAAWRLPGVQPLDPALWLIRDEVFTAQMRLRDRLIAEKPDLIHAILPSAISAADECLDLVLDTLCDDPDYDVTPSRVVRPDGKTVILDKRKPLLTAGRLIQSDLCLMEAGPKGHILSGAILCFPAGWTLSEKIGGTLVSVHEPVDEYDGALERRVQRLFDAIRLDQVLWRANALLHRDPVLFTPRPERGANVTNPNNDALYIRSERQTLRRLPQSGAVVFGIHTYMIPLDRLTDAQRQALHDTELKSG